jgi:PAS domain S-box-containing protein
VQGSEIMNLSLLKSIFASMEHGVLFIDDQNRIAYCNSAAESIRNIRLKEVLGRSILEFHPRESHPKVLSMIEDLRSGKVTGHQRMNLQMVEGKFYDNIYSAVWGPDSSYYGIIVVSQEVTERKKTEDELRDALNRLQLTNEEFKRMDQMKDDFLSSVSHELKTPMISVMGYMGMILKEKVGSLNERQRKFLDVSYKNLLKLGKNIDDLLDLAELGIRKNALAFEPVDLGKVIEFSCSTVEPLAREHQVRIEAQFPPNPVKVPGVEDKLNHLFDNLLINAIKYNRQGGRITVTLYQDPRSAFVRISDTGMGIAPQSLNQVFTRHYQAPAKPLGNLKGLGIGLSLVQEVVKLHRGDINVLSETDKGTTFTVRVPKKLSPCPAATKQKKATPALAKRR